MTEKKDPNVEREFHNYPGQIVATVTYKPKENEPGQDAAGIIATLYRELKYEAIAQGRMIMNITQSIVGVGELVHVILMAQVMDKEQVEAAQRQARLMQGGGSGPRLVS